MPTAHGEEHFPDGASISAARQTDPALDGPDPADVSGGKVASLGTQPSDPKSFSLSLDARYPVSGDYESYYGARLVLEATSTRHQSFGLSCAAGMFRLKSGTRADHAAHDPLVLDFGFFYRLYATPPHTFLRPYATVHANFLWMAWVYRDDIISGGERIGSDSTSGVDLFLGAGLVLNISENIQFYGEIGGGGVSFLNTTQRDLKNDLFDDFGYVGIKGGVGFRF